MNTVKARLQPTTVTDIDGYAYFWSTGEGCFLPCQRHQNERIEKTMNTLHVYVGPYYSVSPPKETREEVTEGCPNKCRPVYPPRKFCSSCGAKIAKISKTVEGYKGLDDYFHEIKEEPFSTYGDDSGKIALMPNYNDRGHPRDFWLDVDTDEGITPITLAEDICNEVDWLATNFGDDIVGVEKYLGIKAMLEWGIVVQHY